MRRSMSNKDKISYAIAAVLVFASVVAMSPGVRAATGRHMADSSGAQLAASPDAVPLVVPTAPSNCKVGGGTASCGSIVFNCDPVSATDTILVSSGRIGVRVTDVQPNIGLILGSYLNTGKASVAVCASQSGFTACGDPIDVTFGKTVCTGGGGGGGGGVQTCPTGQEICRGGTCAPIGSPQCDHKR